MSLLNFFRYASYVFLTVIIRHIQHTYLLICVLVQFRLCRCFFGRLENPEHSPYFVDMLIYMKGIVSFFLQRTTQKYLLLPTSVFFSKCSVLVVVLVKRIFLQAARSQKDSPKEEMVTLADRNITPCASPQYHFSSEMTNAKFRVQIPQALLNIGINYFLVKRHKNFMKFFEIPNLRNLQQIYSYN